MNIIESLKQLVVAMRADSGIFSRLGNRIYIGIPQSETQIGNYLTINIIWQVQNIKVNNRTRIEMRFIGKDNTVNMDTLWEIEQYVYEFIKNKFNDIWFYKHEIGSIANGYDEKKTPILIRDYVLYYITD